MYKYFIIIIYLIISSCAVNHQEELLKNRYINKKVVLNKINHNEKSLYFLPIRHIGTKVYYQQVTTKIDSLQSLGYHFLFEGNSLHKSDKIVSDENVESYLKFRKITGIDILLPYSKIPPYSDYCIKYNLIDQPSYAEFGMNENDSKSADLSIKQLVDSYEKSYPKITLDSCDYNTNLNETYSCTKVDETSRKIFMKDFILKKRNEHLVSQIKNNKNKQLVIIYGENHFDEVKDIFEKN
ncbi:hypothetical protein [Empedobacter stercoris]|uniref:hypothetical protein n=1 Tax=Empedobacter stercoris TaxID=1628248 RepID=UPI0039E9B245